MKTEFYEIGILTKGKQQVVDITSKVDALVAESEIKNGFCIVYSKHTTTSIIINEGDTGLEKDILNAFSKLIPSKDKYEHDKVDSNSQAHLISSLIGGSKVLPIKEGETVRGSWQNVLFVEWDGPRNRTVTVQVIGS